MSGLGDLKMDSDPNPFTYRDLNKNPNPIINESEPLRNWRIGYSFALFLITTGFHLDRLYLVKEDSIGKWVGLGFFLFLFSFVLASKGDSLKPNRRQWQVTRNAQNQTTHRENKETNPTWKQKLQHLATKNKTKPYQDYNSLSSPTESPEEFLDGSLTELPK